MNVESFQRAMSRAVERNKEKQVAASKPSAVVTTTIIKPASLAAGSLLTEDQKLEKYRTTILSLALTYLAKRKYQ